MVKIISSIIALVAFVHGQSGPNDIDPRKFSAIVQMVNSQITTALDYAEVVKKIQNYGCHCFPGMSRAAGGQGAAMDQLDLQCRRLYRCHKCINMEYGDLSSGGCDVDLGKYKYEITGNNIDCSKNTAGTCKMAQCECDRDFAQQVGGFWDDSTYNPHFWLNKHNVKQMATAGTPVFDFSGTCISSGNNVTPDACCGDDYPLKTPYNTGTRGCCGVSGKTFNSMSEECCGSGDIKPIGMC